MNKKTVYVFIFLLVVLTAGYGYFNFIDTDPKETPDQQAEEQPREDRLPKTELEGVEENIHGFDIEDDVEITEELSREETDVLALKPPVTREMLEDIDPDQENTVLKEYDSQLPENINGELQYFAYNLSYNYFLITEEDGAEIREGPNPANPLIGQVENLSKVSLLQRVEGEEVAGSNIWYRVAAEDGEEINEGYLHSTAGKPRSFRFERMKEVINVLREEVAAGDLHFISNYKNQNGTPPQEGDAAVDEHDYRVYHSAPAYEEPSTEANYRYAPDGKLVRILNETDDFYHVNIPTFGDNFYIPKQYIDPDVRFNNLNHVLVVDNDQQNQAAFEVVEDGLNLVSYTLSTTGMAGEFSFRTSPGLYKAQEKRDRFQYLKKGEDEIAGYAPYALRFSGGAYVHGIPVSYEEENGERIDPGLTEYIHTIGTFPRSSMCVRNFTSHAEFIYNWMDNQSGAVLVID